MIDVLLLNQYLDLASVDEETKKLVGQSVTS
jgi:hypothetical protein